MLKFKTKTHQKLDKAVDEAYLKPKFPIPEGVADAVRRGIPIIQTPHSMIFGNIFRDEMKQVK